MNTTDKFTTEKQTLKDDDDDDAAATTAAKPPWLVRLVSLHPFSAGVFTYVAVMSLIQDWFGLEAWIAFVSEHWAPASRTVPMALALLAWVVAGSVIRVAWQEVSDDAGS